MDQTTNYLGVDPCVVDSAAIEQYVTEHFTPKLNVLISFDTESSGGTMIEFGMVVFVRGSMFNQWTQWRRFSACCRGASFDPNEETNRNFWCKFPAQFERIVRHAEPLGEQIARLATLIDAIKRASLSVKFLARPSAYDFHVVAKATEHLGVKNPLGFGGTATLICAGNAANALSRSLGVETPPSFETLMRRLVVEPATHAATDDALSQALVFIAIENASNEVGEHVQRLVEGRSYVSGALNASWNRLRAILAAETPEETELDKRRAAPTDEMRFAFAALLAHLKGMGFT